MHFIVQLIVYFQIDFMIHDIWKKKGAFEVAEEYQGLWRSIGGENKTGKSINVRAGRFPLWKPIRAIEQEILSMPQQLMRQVLINSSEKIAAEDLASCLCIKWMHKITDKRIETHQVKQLTTYLLVLMAPLLERPPNNCTKTLPLAAVFSQNTPL